MLKFTGSVFRLFTYRISCRPLGGFALILAASFFVPINAQENAAVIVQPGAPGQPTRILPSSTNAEFPSYSRKDVEFMQGMIHHHAQAVEMSALIEARTDNVEFRLLGARISHSQAEEIGFMRRWLASRGENLTLPMMDMGNMKDMKDHKHHLMPGMLTPEQMETLRNAKGDEFVRLWLTGMIQHHIGALVMVRELYDAGAGQDAELFTFATDVDSGQRAEIKLMRNMLKEYQ
ncbi:MAG: DUF305 domain-containing protein [Acidobacteriota bacterium]|nr:DUF305 domain-containing protein [Acidobacteriota bacterium]MDH3528909.1 DUF305 domain-containing protein [Acidobacteriota bacterium]